VTVNVASLRRCGGGLRSRFFYVPVDYLQGVRYLQPHDCSGREGEDLTDLSSAVLTEHARNRMTRRGISEADVRETLRSPESTSPVRPGRLVAQKSFAIGDPPRQYLIRVFVDVDRTPPEVVTVYRTSRIGKYRRAP
jgi:hypothetical protein